jgi:hypothetical protein
MFEPVGAGLVPALFIGCSLEKTMYVLVSKGYFKKA